MADSRRAKRRRPHLYEVAEHGELSEAPVLDLLCLEFSEGVGVVSKAEGVEGLSRVQGVKALTGWATVHTVPLAQAHEHHLEAHDSNDGLGVDEAGVAEVVDASLREDVASSLPPDSLAEGGAVVGQDLGGEAADRAEHGPAAVHELDLAVGCECLGVSGEPCGVPAVVTGELTSQVAGAGVFGQRTKPFCAVGSVELDCRASRHLALHSTSGLSPDTHASEGACESRAEC